MPNEFQYNYAAPTENERKEIESLQKKYAPEGDKQEDKLSRLRALDKKVQTFPMILALSLGVIGTLIFGLGLSMCLEWALLIWGTVVALVGCVPLVLAYPVYKKNYQCRKEKYGEEILSLTKELLGNDETCTR